MKLRDYAIRKNKFDEDLKKLVNEFVSETGVMVSLEVTENSVKVAVTSPEEPKTERKESGYKRN